jgi:hypothetical protein
MSIARSGAWLEQPRDAWSSAENADGVGVVESAWWPVTGRPFRQRHDSKSLVAGRSTALMPARMPSFRDFILD